MGRERHALPRGPNSFNFTQFLLKFGQIVCWRPGEGWRPHLGEMLDPPLVESISYVYVHFQFTSIPCSFPGQAEPKGISLYLKELYN